MLGTGAVASEKLTSAGVQPPFADRLVGPPMRLRRWEKERASVGLSRAHQRHASRARTRLGSARAARDSLEDGARSPGRTRDTHPVTGGNECALSFIVPNSGRASLSRPRAQGSDRRCVWGTRRSGSCDVRRGRRRARRCESVVCCARDFDSKTRKTSARASVQLQNFEVVSSVQPIQMFRVLASSQRKSPPTFRRNEKKKCPTVERIAECMYTKSPKTEKEHSSRMRLV